MYSSPLFLPDNGGVETVRSEAAVLHKCAGESGVMWGQTDEMR